MNLPEQLAELKKMEQARRKWYEHSKLGHQGSCSTPTADDLDLEKTARNILPAMIEALEAANELEAVLQDANWSYGYRFLETGPISSARSQLRAAHDRLSGVLPGGKNVG